MTRKELQKGHQMFHVPDQYRITPLIPNSQLRKGNLGNNGMFLIPSPTGTDRKLMIIASDGLGWEHVSVHATKKNSPILTLGNGGYYG